jgi:hypothetical protein
MFHNRSVLSRVSLQKRIEDSNPKQWSPPSLAKMVAGIAIVNLVVALFLQRSQIFIQMAPVCVAFHQFRDQISLPICTVQLAIVWVIFSIRKP